MKHRKYLTTIIRNIFKIVGQFLAVIFTGLLGILLTYEEIPGNESICDAGQADYVFAWFLFSVFSFFLIINSAIFYQKKNWVKYRIIVISTFSLLLFLSLFIKSITFFIFYGNEKYVIERAKESFELIDLKLYENKRFHSWTFDMGCQVGNVGTYTITDKRLTLKFEDVKSEYLGTRYQIENNNIKCLDCDNDLIFKIKN